MQSWMVPGAPLTDADGWRLWYATDGAAPRPVRVQRGGRDLTVSWQVAPPVRLAGFSRTIYQVRVQLPAGEPDGASYAVSVPDTGEEHIWSTWPRALPAEGVSLIYASCFWQQDDAEGALARAVAAVVKLERPVCKLLLGDQLYLDWPPDVAPWRLARGGYRLVGDRYQRYWGDDAYRRFLGATPNVVVADDHEFWNDYPERQIQLPITWRAALRDEFAAAATDYYRHFQAALNPQGTAHPWTIVDLAPASLFVADTRSERSHIAAQPPRLMSAAQWDALEEWQHRLAGPGLLALGQPLFQNDGNWQDHSLSNFTADYRRLLALIRRSAIGDNAQGQPHNIVILSGDIHNARSTWATIPGVRDPDFSRVYELIASANAAIGPYTKAPKPNALPGFLPPGDAQPEGGQRWPVEQVQGAVPYDPIRPGHGYACVDNNLGVLRLRPHPRRPYAVELTNVSYLVRPYRRAFWNFWNRAAQPDYGHPEALRLFSHTLDLR